MYVRFFGCVILLFAASFAGCSPDENQPEKGASASSFDEQEFITRPNPSIVRLLAIKYDVQPASVDTVVRTYLRVQRAVTESTITSLMEGRAIGPTPSITKTIEQLSARYALDKRVIASIILDYCGLTHEPYEPSEQIDEFPEH